jgi:phosphorylcholine metabolism protein LicD
LNNSGIALLNDLNKAFSGFNNSKFIPAYGALLGLYRDGRFIRHDSDLDLFYLSDIKSFNFENFVAIKTKISNSFPNRAGIIEYIGIHNKIKVKIDGVHIDIHIALNSAPSRFTTLKHSLQIHSLTTFKVMGHEILIPSNTEQIIIELYGDDWRTPDRLPYSSRGKWPFSN